MAAQQQRRKGKGKGGHTKDEWHCTNCGKDGHTKEQCWAKGGGKEGQGPHKRQEKSKKDEKNGASNVSTTNKAEEMTESVAFVTISPSCKDDEVSTLTTTSDFRPEVHSTSLPGGIIIDSSAIGHFSQHKSRFLNYRDITPEPIRAADRCTFSALGKAISKSSCQWETMRS